MPLRVAQLVESLTAGGAEALAVAIANELAERGHESHLITLQGGGRYEGRVSPNVTLTVLDRPQTLGTLPTRLAYFRTTYLHLAAFVTSTEIGVVQTHLPKANYLGLFLGHSRKARVYPTVHNNREFDYGDNAGPIKQWARRRAYRQMLSWCDRMIAVSEQVKNGLAAELGIPDHVHDARIVAVPNGVRLPQYVTSRERKDLRARWGVDDNVLMILGVGRLSRQKNFSSLVKSLARLGGRARSWKCIIAGEGELENELQREIDALGLADRINLVGYVADVRSLLAAADVFCLSSLFEGLPLVLLEAMAAGLPVCATKIAGVVDVVTDAEEALLVPADDPAKFALALGTLLSDQELRRNMGTAGRKVVAEKYSFEKMVDHLETIYA